MTDALGNEIKSGEQYFMVFGLPVHHDALEDFVIEMLGAKVETNEKEPSNC